MLNAMLSITIVPIHCHPMSNNYHLYEEYFATLKNDNYGI